MNHRLPRFVIVLLISFATAAAQAQCYVDPYTGQQICMRPSSGCPSCERQVRRLVSDSPAAEPQSPTVDSTAHCRISVADGTMGSGSL
ncbi:MAG TPA: hypothetical protein VFW73_13895, partial [Lacipirellulaceae bacterium]|nr:hypothetical protein [Lacipirellulaceae bacterium]